MATIKKELTIPWLDELIANKGSDVHVASDKRIMYRCRGEMIVSDLPPPTKEDIEVVLDISGAPLASKTELDYSRPDYSFSYHDHIFRMSFFTSACKTKVCAVIRHLPQAKRGLDDLGVPPAFKEKVLRKHIGLILVAGPTGSGKTTTLAAAINYLNNTQSSSIITMEDPIEIWHEENKCRITQLQLGSDFTSYATAITHCLRRDPDVLLVGELRDHASIAAALTAAETGHLVFGTLHTASAKDTITRILDGAPESDRNQQRTMLAKNLLCVVAQKLIPSTKGGMVAAFELMIHTEAIGNLIRKSEFDHIYTEISNGFHNGMVTLDQSLHALLKDGKISKHVAMENAFNRDAFERKLSSAA